MKILHLLDEPWDSGITAYALQTAQLLDRAKMDVTVGVLSGKAPERQAKALGLKTAPIDSLLDVVRLLSRNWDVVNPHTGRMHTWSVLLTKLIGRRPPVVRTRGDARALPVHAITRFMYRRTAAVIAASAHIGEQYEAAYGFSEQRLRVIYPSVPALPSAGSYPPDRVGILGRLDHVKGHSIFLEAAATVLRKRPAAKFLIAGKEAGVSIELLRNQARALGIDRSVDFLGFRPSATAFMESCSVGVIASVGSEEISRACLEWMSVGRPVVGTLVGCLSELIEPEETGFLVPPNDGAEMAKCILQLLEDPSLAERLGHNARAVTDRKFSAAVQLNSTLDLYRQAMKGD